MEDKDERLLIIRSTNRCNNKCVMCNIDSSPEELETVEAEAIVEQLKDRRSKGYRLVEFTGGEPTVRKDLSALIKTAKDLGFEKITITTNGQLLADPEFCKNLIESGLNGATISLDGSKPEIHDSITKNKGSFELTLKGLKNFLSYYPKDVTVVSVVMRPNYQDLYNIGELIMKLGVRHWHLSDMTPEARAFDDYENLSVRRSELKKEFKRVAPLFRNFFSIGIFSFSHCLFPDKLANSVFFFDIEVKMRKWDISGDQRHRVDEENRFTDNLKQMVPMCDNCEYRMTCGGVWKKYLEIYGERDL